MFGLENKLTLYGFNNLTKTLSFNIYDVCYAKSERAQKDYVAYIDEQYNSERLTRILCDVTEIIGAHVLNISKQDYEPQGASVTLLISENDMPEEMMDKSCNHGHLASRATCGEISPLNALDYLIGSFDSDIITADYRVRGFTRDNHGNKLFIDHDITSIQDYIATETMQKYDAIDINVYQANLFHTKLLIKEIELQNYLFNTDVYELSPKERLAITDRLRREMIEIFSGTNVYK